MQPNAGNLFGLLVVIIRLIVDHVEESELVYALGGGDDTEPVTKLLLLEELLGAVTRQRVFSHLAP